MIPINLKLTNEKGNSTFEDEFEWDILNESNKYFLLYSVLKSLWLNLLTIISSTKHINLSCAISWELKSTSNSNGSSNFWLRPSKRSIKIVSLLNSTVFMILCSSNYHSFEEKYGLRYGRKHANPWGQICYQS